ncbi:MAG: hypothetical protein SCARUB_02545 [Candidatus Scalindua rubra]|uniref:Uncharacterized protein n=1 Tax=Candidatus Scalindua rubra TaxID=1872076 RepID=A0A1E3X9T7_9BACT|nr:MAG: hypothetical protein SCARUB_02545 [Candidatus Scalindua rubra]
MFSTEVPESELEYEVSMSLDTIEQAYVNYHFCQRYPKFEVTLNRFYKEYLLRRRKEKCMNSE